MSKILHLIEDEKFTADLVANFEKVYDKNTFFILRSNNKPTYFSATQPNVFFGESKFFHKKNIESDVSAVIVHGLNYVFSNLLLELKPDIKIAWIPWGYDIYHLSKIAPHIYGDLTLKYLEQRSTKKLRKLITLDFFSKSLSKISYLIYSLKYNENLSIKAHEKIKYFCSYLKEDYDMFSEYYPNKHIFLEVPIFNLYQYLGEQKDFTIKIDAKDIFIGNSASAESNHIDVLNKLTLNEKDVSKIIVALNYGHDKDYKNLVIECGKKIFGKDIMFLNTFLEKKEYFDLLSNCSVAIFYHYRQQAMGNIIALLFMGVRVYLSSKNPVYAYFNRLGVKVFNFDTDYEVFGTLCLEKELQLQNREILMRIFNEERVERQQKQLIFELLNVN